MVVVDRYFFIIFISYSIFTLWYLLWIDRWIDIFITFILYRFWGTEVEGIERVSEAGAGEVVKQQQPHHGHCCWSH